MSIADKLTQIANNVPNVYNSGKTNGYNEGVGAGSAQGFLLGRHQEYIDFWNSFTENWTRVNYRYSFGGVGWNEKTFNPPQTIKPTNAQYLFYAAGIVKVTKAQLALSNNTNSTGVFYACSSLAEIEEIQEEIETKAI